MHADQEGFTLVELLVVLVILPIVVAALAYGLVTVLALQPSTSNGIANSGDAQVVSANYVKDVQSSESVTTDRNSSPQCGTGSQLLGLQWNGGQTLVSYDLATSGGVQSLVREYCLNGSTVPVDSTTIANNLLSTQPSPVISCTSAATQCSSGAYTSGWIPSVGVLGVAFSVTDSERSSSYLYDLSATPLVWNTASPSSTYAVYPLTLLGSTNCATPALVATGGTLTVGTLAHELPIAVAGNCAGSVQAREGCGAAINASQLIGQQATNNDIYGNDGCSGKGTPPPESSPTTAIGDPFAGLTPPPNPANASPASCSGKGPYTCTSGTYTSSAGLPTGSPSITFAGGADTVFNQLVDLSKNGVGGNATVTFKPGNYWFKGGLNIGNSDTVVFDAGVYVVGDSSNPGSCGSVCLQMSGNAPITTPNGALFYVQAGQVQLANPEADLTGESAYANIALWDAASSAFTVSGGTSSSFGGVYAPNASFSDSGSTAFNAQFLIVSTMNLSGGVPVNLGANFAG